MGGRISHLVHMIWIDGTYDMVGSQERIKYHRVSGVDFGPVDPVMYAEAFGATGLRIDRPDQITAALRKALDTPGPVLVGVRVDYRQNVKLFEKVYEGSIL
jgi:acetolactate synthase I/II/III large subunit